jgi:hypothetical protein
VRFSERDRSDNDLFLYKLIPAIWCLNELPPDVIGNNVINQIVNVMNKEVDEGIVIWLFNLRKFNLKRFQ